MAQKLLDAVPLAVGCAYFSLTTCIFFLYGQWDLELTAVVNVKIIMPRVIGMQDKLLHFVCICIKQDVHSESKIVKKSSRCTWTELVYEGKESEFSSCLQIYRRLCVESQAC